MSDCFDHMAIAYESAYNEDGYDYNSNGGFPGPHRRRARASHIPFHYDPLFYHTRVPYKRIVAETNRAYLLELENSHQVWFPKKACKNWQDGTVHIHSATMRASVEYHLEHTNES